MTTDQATTEERAQGIAGALAEIDPNTIQVRTEKLDGFLNGVMLPFVGLHVAMIGTLILGLESPNSYASLRPLFLLIGVGIALIAWLRRRADGGHVPRQAPSAAFCFLLAASVTLTPVGLAAALIALAYCALAALAYRKHFSAIELVFPSIYVPVFESAFWVDDLQLSLLLFAFCFVLGGVVLWRLKAMPYAIGLLIGAAILLVSKIQTNASDEAAIVAVCVLFAAAAAVYEFLVGGRQFSNLRYFLSQGVVAILFLVIVMLLMPDSEETAIWIWTATVAIYSGAMVGARPGQGAATRFGWIAIAVLAAILTQYSPRSDGGLETWLPIAACLATVIGLAYGAKHLGSAFIHNLSQLLLVLLCLLIYDHVTRIDHAVFWLVSDQSADEQFAMLASNASENRAATIGAAGLVLLAYVAGYMTRHAYAYPRAVAWWRGLIRPRHAVILRKLFRATAQQAQGIPFVGGFLTAIMVAIRSLRYLKGGSAPISFGDLVEIALNIFVALSGAVLLKLWLIPLVAAESHDEALADAYRTAFIAAWVSWGILLYLRGVWSSRAQLIFLGVGFVIVPPIKFIAVDDFPQAPFLAAILMTSGLALCLFGLVRRAEKK